MNEWMIEAKFKYGCRESCFTTPVYFFLYVKFPCLLLSIKAATIHAGFSPICRIGGYGFHYDQNTGSDFLKFVLLPSPWEYRIHRKETTKLNGPPVGYPTSHWADPSTQASPKKKFCSYPIAPFHNWSKIQIF